MAQELGERGGDKRQASGLDSQRCSHSWGLQSPSTSCSGEGKVGSSRRVGPKREQQGRQPQLPARGTGHAGSTEKGAKRQRKQDRGGRNGRGLPERPRFKMGGHSRMSTAAGLCQQSRPRLKIAPPAAHRPHTAERRGGERNKFRVERTHGSGWGAQTGHFRRAAIMCTGDERGEVWREWLR